MKSLKKHYLLLGITASISFMSATSSVMANSCSKADIDYYLQRGFSHDQVIRLCATSNANPNSQATMQQPQQTRSNVNNFSNNPSLNEDRIYFKTVLNAQAAQLTPETLSYTAKECVKYGDESLAGLKDKVCVNSDITIDLKGLKVIKAIKGIFLVREQKMIIQGNIQRKYLNLSSLSHAKQTVIQRLLPQQANRLNLPVLKGIDPKQVAQKLKKYSGS